MGSDDFLAFWGLYPRKVAKKDAAKAWGQMNEMQRFAALAALPIHVRFWSLAGTSPEFLPYPASWCRGERWEDELQMPRDQNDWWRSGEGIVAKAGQLGVKVRPGESYEDLKARVMAAMR